MDLQCPENTVNLFSLRRLNGAGCEEVYTNLFETSSVWQVFKVGVSSVPWKVSYEKRLFRSKKDYQGQILVNYSCHGWTFKWESLFLEKHRRYVFRVTLSLVVVPKCFHNSFLCLYLSKR